jgi:endonuclease/exonuclease/phosphatase family metal-dependent hydrolase
MAPAPPRSFVQFNICGHACGLGFTVADDVATAVKTHVPPPSAIMLEEVCRSQYGRVAALLPAYTGHFETTIAHRCQDGSDYGIALFLRAARVSLVGGWELPNPAAGEARHVVCVRTREFGGVRPTVACVTHIDTTPANRGPQIAFVARTIGALTTANQVIVGGDFNVVPDDGRLDPMYAVSSSAGDNTYTNCGGHRHPCGPDPGGTKPTNKIDYVFVSRDATGVSAHVVTAEHSDHAMLWATATFG